MHMHMKNIGGNTFNEKSIQVPKKSLLVPRNIELVSVKLSRNDKKYLRDHVIFFEKVPYCCYCNLIILDLLFIHFLKDTYLINVK